MKNIISFVLGILLLGLVSASYSPSSAPIIYESGNFSFPGGNVGIGTSSPSADLQVGAGGGGVDENGLFVYKSSNVGYDVMKIMTDYSDGNRGNLLNVSTASGTKFLINGYGNVGIGTTTPASKLDVNGALLLENGSWGNPTGSSSLHIRYDATYGANFRSRDWDGSTWKPMLFEASGFSFLDGNVGIGTSPTSKLHIKQSDGTYDSGIKLERDGANTNTFAMVAGGDNQLYLGYGATNTITDDIMVIDGANKNVGIGTNSPSASKFSTGTILNVNGGDGLPGGLALSTSTASSARAEMYINSAGNLYVDSFGGTPATKNQINFRTDSGAGGTSPTSRMVITSDGNVGIGTSSPGSTKLNIDNTGNVNNWGFGVTSTTTSGQSYGGIITAGTSSSDTAFEVRNAANSAYYLKVRGDGNVGIGTSSPSDKLQIDTSAWGMRIQSEADSSYLRLSTNQISAFNSSGGNSPLYLQYSSQGNTIINNLGGNVGIGTSNPSDPLTVAGAGIIRLEGVGNTWRFMSHTSDGNFYIRDETNANTVLTIENNSGNVGIGTDSPGSALEVSASYSPSSAPVIYGYSITGYAGTDNAIGVQGKGYQGVRGIGLDAGVAGQGDYAGVLGNGDIYDFYADGSGTDYGTSSSIRWKNNITEIDDALDKVLKLDGVYYDWDEEHGGLHDMGFIAEDVGIVVPEIVGFEDAANESNWYVDEEGKRKLYASGVDYGALTPMLVEAIKELKEENEILKEELCLKDNTYSWCN